MPPPPSSSGFFGALRVLADSLCASVEKRLELLALEIREEEHRLIGTFLWLGAILGAGMLALIFVSLAAILAFPPSDRLAALCAVAFFHAALVLVLALGFRRRMAAASMPFNATLEELGRDRACIRKTN